LDHLALSWRRIGFCEHRNTAPNLCQHFRRGQLITRQASLSRPALIAPFAAASQLEPMFNFGGRSASADTTCDSSGMTGSTIVVAKSGSG